MKEKKELTPTLARHLNIIEGWSLARIGRQFNLSRERVRQIRNEGLDILKRKSIIKIRKKEE